MWFVFSCRNENSNISEASKLKDSFVRVSECEVVGIDPGTAVLGQDGFWKGVFIQNRRVKLNEFAISQYGLTYKLWNEVYDWAVKNGYSFANAGQI